MKLKNGMFVICPEGDVAPYLTNGKKYEVYNVEETKKGVFLFNINCDNGIMYYCLIHESLGCAHLKGKHWIIDNPEKP